MTQKTQTQKFFDNFFSEKDLGEQTYDVESANGTLNVIPTSSVIDAIKSTQGNEAKKIESILRQIDFANGDVHHFLKHMAQGLAVDLEF
tara:strand:+ start:241 stop:507 length:267 start_codon:yes stop_codon:yes gene_type:complete